jgi:predicted nuclease of predicted toxin-antitoxin system
VSPRFLADENVEPDLVMGLKRRVEGIDIVRVQDVGLRTLDDPATLQWAADDGRVLIGRDIKTIPTFAHARVVAGQIMPGVFILRWPISMSEAIDDIATAHSAAGPGTSLRVSDSPLLIIMK